MLVGAFIPLAAVPMAIILIVATVTVHWPNGFSSIKLLAVDAGGAHFGQPGYETDLLYFAALFALVIGGSGPLAVDTALLCGGPSICRLGEKVRVESDGVFPRAASDGR